MAWDRAAIQPVDTASETRHMTMGAAPIPDRAEAGDGSTASRRNRRAASHLFAASREKGSTAYHT
jgi:hypothetical protein